MTRGALNQGRARTQTRASNSLVNDTIFNLLRVKYKHPENVDEAMNNFNYLTAIGLHASAYNMLFEWSWYDDINWTKIKWRSNLLATALAAPPIP